MSIFEYNKEEEEKKLRKAEYEAGEKSGIRNTDRKSGVKGESEELGVSRMI